MKELLMTLLFSKAILLAPAPVSLPNGSYSIDLKEPLSAVNRSASIYIDITSHVKNTNASLHPDRIAFYESRFPKKSIHGTLTTSNGSDIRLIHRGFVYSNEWVKIKLGPEDALMPTDTKFTSIRIWSDGELNDVTVWWYNAGK